MTLIERLRGVYRIPITDGLGPAGGEEPDNPNEFVRTYDVPPIQHEAADALESKDARIAELEAERDSWKQEFRDAYRRETEARQELSALRQKIEQAPVVAWLRTSGHGTPVVTEELLQRIPEDRGEFSIPLTRKEDLK